MGVGPKSDFKKLMKPKMKELAISRRIEVLKLLQNDLYLQLNAYLSLGKSATVSF